MRMFVAAELSDEVRKALAAAQRSVRDRLGDRARWSSPDTMHLTLKFLGEVAEDRLTPLRSALAGALAGPIPAFDVRVRGLGVFPGPRRPNVLWAGLQDESGGDLARLHRTIDAAAAEAGFTREDRPFKPHLTLARFKPGPPLRGLDSLLEEAASDDLGSFRVGSAILFQSILKPGGAEHRKIEEYLLS